MSATSAARSDEQARLAPVVAGLMLSMFLVALDSTIVSTAMPTIVGNLGGFSLYAWVPAIYLLTTAVTTPIYGKLADLFGRKPVLFFGIGLFLVGSAASGMANSMLLLILFRAVQGIGAGAVMPTTMTIIGDIFTLEQRARMQGFFSSVWGASAVIGPLLGGLLVDSVGWRWIFYLNIPVGLLAVAVIAGFFHERSVHREHKLDIAGATYLTVLLTALLLILIEGGQSWAWVSPQTAALLVLAAVALFVFLREEGRAAEPVIPMDLWRNRIIAVAAIGGFFLGAVMVSVSFEIPLYAQGVRGLDALHAGYTLAPMTMGWPLAGAFSGRLAIRYGYRMTASIGMTVCTVGVALLLMLSLNSPIILAAAFSFLIGVGLGLSATPIIIAVQSAVDWTRRGIATGTNMFVRSFGSVVGLAVMSAIVNNVTGHAGGSSATNQTLDVHARGKVPAAVLDHVHQTLMTGIHNAFFAAVVASILGAVAMRALPGGSARDHEARGEGGAEVKPLEMQEIGA